MEECTSADTLASVERRQGLYISKLIMLKDIVRLQLEEVT